MELVADPPNGIHSMLDFLRDIPVPKHDLDFFKAITQLQQYFTNPSYVPVAFISLYNKPREPVADLYFAKTIRNPETVPHTLMFVKQGYENWPLPNGSPEPAKSRPFPSPEVPDVTTFWDLQAGMNGFSHTAHGGAMCALLDETMGMCGEIYKQTQFKGQKTTLYTAQLNTSFLAPVVTPGIVSVKAWLVGAKGRKWNMRAQVVDLDGRVLMECESLWISTREEGSL